MTKPVTVATYRGHQRAVRDALAAVAKARTDGLAKIASRDRKRIDREDACSAYAESRFWLRTYRERLAAVHPEKNCHLSPAAKARHDARHE